MKNMIVVWKPSGLIFGEFWDPTWRSRGVLRCRFRWFLGSWGLLGAKMAPRSLEEPYNVFKMASRTDFEFILVDALLIYDLVFLICFSYFFICFSYVSICFYIILCGFHMILYDFYMMFLWFYVIFIWFYMILICFSYDFIWFLYDCWLFLHRSHAIV